MTELITDKKEIDKIIEKKIKGKKIVFTNYYYLRLGERGLEHEKVRKILLWFDKIFAIEIDMLKFGDRGYELFYDLGSDVTFSIATVPKEKM